jgi:hypothetical protein
LITNHGVERGGGRPVAAARIEIDEIDGFHKGSDGESLM